MTNVLQRLRKERRLAAVFFLVLLALAVLAHVAAAYLGGPRA